MARAVTCEEVQAIVRMLESCERSLGGPVRFHVGVRTLGGDYIGGIDPSADGYKFTASDV